MSSDAPVTAPATTAHAVEFRVRYAETDRMGVVYHAEYLVWCEVGRTEFIRDRWRSYADLEATGVMLAVAEATVRYHAGARYDDLVRVETRLAELRSRMLRFAYEVRRAGTGERLVSATTTLVAVDGAGRTVSLPAELRAALSPHVG